MAMFLSSAQELVHEKFPLPAVSRHRLENAMSALQCRVILLAFFCLWGCSKANDNSTILDANGKHPANWIVNHREAFRTLAGAIDDPTVAAKSRCVECHGVDLGGGNVKVG